jgi:hypothetical protein
MRDIGLAEAHPEDDVARQTEIIAVDLAVSPDI